MGLMRWLLGGSEEEADPTDELRAWRIADVQNDASGDVAVFRIRIARPALERAEEWKMAVSIRWLCVSADELPSRDETERMDTMERRLDELTGGNGFSQLMYVATGLGAREWVFYTRAPARFVARLGQLLGPEAEHPIQIETIEDPSWQRWEEIAESLGLGA